MDCGVCLENKIEDNFTILPCNHKVCNECFPKIRVPVCPFCRHKYGNTNDRYYNEIDDELFDFQVDIVYFSDDEELYSQRTHRRNRRRQSRRNRNPRARQPTNHTPINIIHLPNINIDNIINIPEISHPNTKPKRKFKNNGKRRVKTANSWNFRNLQNNISQSY
jgi:hypothetical protein